jgi:hypothetical protein
MLRYLLASLLLINYLLVVGLGCISRPEDRQEFVLVQTSEAGKQYQECRYMRMDGLENFLLESLATRYHKTTDTPKHHLISVVSGVDSHYLPCTQWPIQASVYAAIIRPLTTDLYAVPAGYGHSVHIPPRLS